MNKIFNLTSTFKTHTEKDGSASIRGMASTSDFDRAGDSIAPDAWTRSGGLNNFKKNPNKINYIYVLTPQGVSEKTKLTLNFMKRKMKEYDELKKEIKE